jgi:hypothetical protein
MFHPKNSYSRLLTLICSGAILLAAIITPAHTAGAYTTGAFTTSSAAVAAPATGPIYKYLIHQGTGGPVACGDSLVGVYVGQRSGDIKRDEATALNSLFATPKNYIGLYNPLSASRLKVGNVQYNSAKNAVIRLNGKLVRPTKFCEVARARAMVWATAQQFPEVKHAIIWYGDVLLGDMLSAKDTRKN